MTSDTKEDASLNDVLNEMALASATPTAKVVGAYVRRYPQYAEEITDFAAELAAVAVLGQGDDSIEPSTEGTSPIVSKALSKLQNRLYELKQELSARADSIPDLFGALDQGQFRSLAGSLGVNAFFLAKIRDRTIVPDTIPRGFRLKVADAFSVSEPVVAAYLARPPRIPEQMRFLSERKPEAVRQQSFADAVRSSSLSDEQQQTLLSL